MVREQPRVPSLEPGAWLDRTARLRPARSRGGDPHARPRSTSACRRSAPRPSSTWLGERHGLRAGRRRRGGLDVDDLGHGARDAARRAWRSAHTPSTTPSSRAARLERQRARDRRLGGPAPRRAGQPPTLFSYPDRRARHVRRAHARVRCARRASRTPSRCPAGYQRPGPARPARHPAHVREPDAARPRASARPSRSRGSSAGRRRRSARRSRAPDPAARPAAWGGRWCAAGSSGRCAAFGASKALSLISILVLARLLAPDEFGVVAAVAAYIALIELGSDLGHEARRSSTSRRRASARGSRPRSR